jgi:hypothetical protein
MKKFDYNTVKERLNNIINSQLLELPIKYDEFHACVNEYIVRVNKIELIKK